MALPTETLACPPNFMKTLIGKTAVWISEKILDTIILWAAGFKRQGKTSAFKQAPFIWPVKRHIAVESAEKQLKNAPLGLLQFFLPIAIFIASVALVVIYLLGLWVCFLVAAISSFFFNPTPKDK